MTKTEEKTLSIAVIGLGYVGLPLALEFGKHYKTIAFDLSKKKVSSYLENIDPTGEVDEQSFLDSIFFTPTSNEVLIKEADFIIVAVPTPVDKDNKPDFTPLESASKIVGRNMKQGSTIVFESTVYPGATEEKCMPIIQEVSGYVWKEDFYLGYSPERINPGDKDNSLTQIVKVVAGDSQETLERVAEIYESIISAGVYKASSIKVAEAAKVIENTQRDLNIALVNELAVIFHKLNIDTSEVLEAAGTKWNFLPFTPGLVGGHCIGVDPYYLTYKAEEVGYNPQVILSGRKINDEMASFIAEEVIKELSGLNIEINNTKVIVMGLTFKENCPDLRNSKVADLIQILSSKGLEVFIYDPIANTQEALEIYGLELTPWADLPNSSVIIEAVPHDEIINLSLQSIQDKLDPGCLFVDVKSRADKSSLMEIGYKVWRL